MLEKSDENIENMLQYLLSDPEVLNHYTVKMLRSFKKYYKWQKTLTDRQYHVLYEIYNSQVSIKDEHLQELKDSV